MNYVNVALFSSGVGTSASLPLKDELAAKAYIIWAAVCLFFKTTLPEMWNSLFKPKEQGRPEPVEDEPPNILASGAVGVEKSSPSPEPSPSYFTVITDQIPAPVKSVASTAVAVASWTVSTAWWAVSAAASWGYEKVYPEAPAVAVEPPVVEAPVLSSSSSQKEAASLTPLTGSQQEATKSLITRLSSVSKWTVTRYAFELRANEKVVMGVHSLSFLAFILNDKDVSPALKKTIQTDEFVANTFKSETATKLEGYSKAPDFLEHVKGFAQAIGRPDLAPALQEAAQQKNWDQFLKLL